MVVTVDKKKNKTQVKKMTNNKTIGMIKDEIAYNEGIVKIFSDRPDSRCYIHYSGVVDGLNFALKFIEGE